jgi:hypothetical protein
LNSAEYNFSPAIKRGTAKYLVEDLITCFPMAQREERPNGASKDFKVKRTAKTKLLYG